MKNDKKGILHILSATAFSIQGLRWIWQHETAFRHDIILCTILITVSVYKTDFGVSNSLGVIIASAILLITEIINSALECIVDLVSPEFSVLAKAAKDMGSLAVLVALIQLGIVTAVILL